VIRPKTTIHWKHPHPVLTTTSKPYQKLAFGVLGGLAVVAFLWGSTLIPQERIEGIAAKMGIWGFVPIGLFILSTQVFAPLSGSPGIFIAIKLYGFVAAMTLFYCVSMLSATINFYIARRFGRAAVLRLVGEDGIKRIDSIAETESVRILILARVFGYYFFDFISYAMGLTSISFSRYFACTASFTLLPIALQTVFFRHLDFSSLTGISIYYGSLVLVTLIFGRLFARVLRKPQANA
jgi:uncharacterized membrane protein YdjX (TVP38/TMEM64 family)